MGDMENLLFIGVNMVMETPTEIFPLHINGCQICIDSSRYPFSSWTHSDMLYVLAREVLMLRTQIAAKVIASHVSLDAVLVIQLAVLFRVPISLECFDFHVLIT